MTRTDDGKELKAFTAWWRNFQIGFRDSYYEAAEAAWQAAVSHQQASLPVEAIQAAIGALQIQREYRAGEAAKTCTAHINALKSVLPSPPESLMPKE